MATSGSRGGRPKVMALCMGCLLGLLAAEVAVRFWIEFRTKDTRWYLPIDEMKSRVEEGEFVIQPHPYLAYATTPDFEEGGQRHNSLGYRHGEIEIPKPEGTFRIVAMGGSTTYSSSIDDNEATFTYRLQEMLREQYGHASIEVINAGAQGYTSWETLINFQLRVLDLEPDLIMVYHAFNEVWPRLVDPEDYRGDNAQRMAWTWPEASIFEWSALYRYVSRIYGTRFEIFNLMAFVENDDVVPDDGTIERLVANPPIYFRRNLEHLIAIARLRGVDVLFASFAYLKDYADDPKMDLSSGGAYAFGIAEHNQVIRELTREYGLHYFDYAALMSQDRKLWVDGIHVNDEGAIRKAALYAKFLDENAIPHPRSE